MSHSKIFSPKRDQFTFSREFLGPGRPVPSTSNLQLGSDSTLSFPIMEMKDPPTLKAFIRQPQTWIEMVFEETWKFCLEAEVNIF